VPVPLSLLRWRFSPALRTITVLLLCDLACLKLQRVGWAMLNRACGRDCGRITVGSPRCCLPVRTPLPERFLPRLGFWRRTGACHAKRYSFCPLYFFYSPLSYKPTFTAMLLCRLVALTCAVNGLSLSRRLCTLTCLLLPTLLAFRYAWLPVGDARTRSGDAYLCHLYRYLPCWLSTSYLLWENTRCFAPGRALPACCH